MNCITIQTIQDIEMQKLLERVIKKWNYYVEFKIENITDLNGLSMNYELVFLDVDNDGISKAQFLRSNGYIQAIIFYASTKNYAFQCLSIHSFDYLLKPLNDKKVEDVLNQYLYFQGRLQKTIVVKNSRGHPKYSLLTQKIEYIESSNTRLTIHLINKRTIHLYAKLNDIEKEMNDSQFLRCHQSFLVNMNYISQADDAFVMCSGAKVPIRVRNKPHIKEVFNQYILNNC